MTSLKQKLPSGNAESAAMNSNAICANVSLKELSRANPMKNCIAQKEPDVSLNINVT